MGTVYNYIFFKPMDAIKAAFESQFGTEWSAPVKEGSTKSEDSDSDDGSQEVSANSVESEAADESSASEEDDEEDGPITVKHNEETINQQPLMSSNQRRKFMNAEAPKDDSVITTQPKTKEDNEDLQNDLALQRLIDESHILSERPKSQQFTGADISGAGDPLERIGGSRVKIMESRLAKAGAKSRTQRMPQAMAVGIRDKVKERKDKYRSEAREAGIVIAKERHTRSKNRFRDRGLKINTVGKASEHGIHVSPAEIARLTGKNKRTKRK